MSAKTSAQPGRRTPLSLNAAVPKQQQQQFNKPSPGTSGAKNDNKTTKDQKTESAVVVSAPAELKDFIQKDTKKQPIAEKKQQNNADNTKKSEKTEEKKSQNGVGKVNVKEKQQQGNGNEKNGNGNDNQEKKDKTEKVDKNDKVGKVVEKPDNKEEQQEIEVIEIKEKKENEKKPTEKVKKTDSDSSSSVEKKKSIAPSEKAENMEISVGCEEKAATPKKPVIEKKTATPTKLQTAEKVTPIRSTAKAAITPVKATTLATEDVEMEPLTIEPSPIKVKPAAFESAIATIIPTATSTPGKTSKNKQAAKLEGILSGGNSSPLPDRSTCVRNYSQISGRRTIRPISNEYTPSQFNSNVQFRESYRRINTELDVTSTTNTSLNVTVGSEVPNNSSFSMFFGRALGGRKRERTPPNSLQSTMDLHAEYSPPKRARLDVQSFFSAVVGSPLSLLRSRFSKTSIQSSTPVKLHAKLASAEDEEEVGEEVQNVSGISIEEEIPNGTGEELTATDDATVGNEADEVEKSKKDSGSPIKDDVGKIDATAEVLVTEKCDLEKTSSSANDAGADNTDDIKITETPIGGGNDPAKNKRCSIM